MSQNRGSQPQQQGLQTTRPQTGGGAVEKATPMTGKLTRLPTRGSISTTDPNQASQWIEEAYETSGLVLAPFGNSVPLMPPGYGISVTPVAVTDFDDGFDGTEIYPIKGSQTKKGLLKGVLDSCATGMGFDWPPQWTWPEKFGDERDNDRLCQKITVCGRYKDVDGSWKTLPPQTKEIDLREGSSEVEEVRARHLAKQLYGLPRDATPQARAERERIAKQKADNELAQTRKFIRSHAQTKARLMVIGTRMRRSYTLQELKKGPFYCFRVIQTWRSEDPETQKQFNQAIIERELGASNMLFGEQAGAAPETRALPPVSNEAYPEPEDAGVVAEATVEPETTQEPEVKQCNPTCCYGADPAAQHVNACYGSTEAKPETKPTQTAPDAPAGWKITRGSARGLEVNDRRVTPETLKELRTHYLIELDPNGPDFSSMNPERLDLLSGELREIVSEMRKRGIKD